MEEKILSTQVLGVEETIDFSEMKFEPIKKILSYEDKDGQVKKVYIYNADNEKKEAILKIFAKYGEANKNGQLNLNIPQQNVLKEVLPILTNYNFSQLSGEQIDEILSDPAPILEETMLYVTEIMIKIMENFYKTKKIEKETLTKIFGIDDEKLIEIARLQNQQKELELKIEQERQKNQDIIPKPKSKRGRKKKVEEPLNNNEVGEVSNG